VTAGSERERRSARSHDLGRMGEDAAAQFLQSQGHTILVRNWRCRSGEIDIVSRDGDCVVFTEVKARAGAGFGSPGEAVGPIKQRRLRTLAAQWLREADRWAPSVRFDVVAVHSQAGQLRVVHYRDAM